LAGFQELKLGSNLDPNTIYYWRLTFLCSGGLDDPNARQGGSSTASFITGSDGNILPAPAPLSPAEGSITSGPTFFRWSPVKGARGYLLSSGSNGFFFPDFVNGTDTEYEVDFTYSSGHYNWSVAAYNDYAVGSFSTPISYENKGIAVTIPE